MSYRSSRYRGLVKAPHLIGSALTLLASGLAGAQTWNLPGMTQAITGAPYDTTETAALVISGGHLYYCDWQGQTSPPSPDVGKADSLYTFPVTWYGASSATYYGDDPGSSPTGKPVYVSASVSAGAYHIDGTHFQGYMVGLVTTYSFSSAGSSGNLVIFAPGLEAATAESAQAMAAGLATGAQQGDPSFTGGQAECIAQCKNTYEADKKNAYDEYVTNMKVYCGVLGVPAGFIAGCEIGTAICGWVAPPFSTLFCCIGGGIIGSGVTFGGCAYAQNEFYQSKLRQAYNNYVACLRNCGANVVEN